MPESAGMHTGVMIASERFKDEEMDCFGLLNVLPTHCKPSNTVANLIVESCSAFPRWVRVARSLVRLAVAPTR